MVLDLGRLVTRAPLTVVVGWLVVLLALVAIAPPWEQVAHDGDFAYLPDTLPSQQANAILRRAFPEQRANSRIVLITHRDDRPLSGADLKYADAWAARWHARHALGLLAAELTSRGSPLDDIVPAGSPRNEEPVSHTVPGALPAAERRPESSSPAETATAPPSDRLRQARDAIDAAMDFQEQVVEALERDHIASEAGQDTRFDRSAWLTRAVDRLGLYNAILARIGELTGSDTADEDLARARRYTSEEMLATLPDLAREARRWPIAGVMTWRHPLFGEKFRSSDRQARLIVVQLTNEVAATGNVALVEALDEELEVARAESDGFVGEGLGLHYTGDAALGGDMLRSARDSIRQTHLVTLILVAVFLILVYRSPVLVGIVLLSLVVALQVSLTGIATVAGLWGDLDVGGWQYRIFTTTQIFIVAILFGSGTDFCLFLISRYREEQEAGRPLGSALRMAVRRVMPALIGSAMTTVIGLGMLFFSRFGKSSSSGPTVAASLIVTLAACLTLTPAALALVGRWAFWPRRFDRIRRPDHNPPISPSIPPSEPGTFQAASVGSPRPASGRNPTAAARLWTNLGRIVATRPGPVAVVVTLALLPPVVWGALRGHHVTYDITSEISVRRPSRAGLAVLENHFPIGETGPLTVLVMTRHDDLLTPEGREPIADLTRAVHGPGLRAVYSLSDPLGRPTPKKAAGGLLDFRRWRGWVASAHREAEALFTAPLAEGGAVARLEVIGTADPFSDDAVAELAGVRQRLADLAKTEDSYWYGSTFVITGTAASLADLKSVTRSDLLRTQILVTLAVLIVLIVLLRRIDVCLMMVGTVIVGYLATLGITEAFFSWLYGASYEGLDWKLPLFLFVVLVAVGQDYNVYLATRVLEEQARHGPVAGLIRGVGQTGAIISSCGVIMAVTFFSMTASGWLPEIATWIDPAWGETFAPGLRGVIELGFAMTVGIVLDTFVVRTLLFPALLALRDRFWGFSGNAGATDGT